jgi:hypothetical protein
MPQNAARRINREAVVKSAISATFCHTQLFEITGARKMKSPFVCNIHAETQKLWKRSAIRVAASRPDAVQQSTNRIVGAYGVSISRPQTSSARASKSM